MLTLCWIRGPESSRLPAVDPLVEARAGGLLDLPGGHHLDGVDRDEVVLVPVGAEALEEAALHDVVGSFFQGLRDPKSTRLDSSHVRISHAVLCLEQR